VKITDSGSIHNGQVKDIYIDKGIIADIGEIDRNADVKIEEEGIIATQGLFDLRCRHGEPGYEQNEDIESIIAVASSAGYTGIATLPDALSNRSQIEYLIKKTERKSVSIYPLGATTTLCEGNELAELFDMHLGGAIGFSNGDTPYNSGTLQRALLYTKHLNKLIFSHAEDKYLSNGGFVNESNETTALGLKYFPKHAEHTCIAKEIEIARYTDSSLHFSHISTKESVLLIKKAKSEGLKVSADVSILHLIYTDNAMSDFNANLKLMPPLRGEEDRLALIKGINEGVIDCIVSDHNPHCSERKLVEFNYSPFGAITLQLVFSLYNTYLTKYITLDTFIKATSENPRALLNLPKTTLEPGNTANLAIFNRDTFWEFNQVTNKSLSKNSHLMDHTLKGKCIFTVNGLYYNSPS
jgi:dihydroorotase